MSLTGKGMMIWRIPYCEGGNPSTIANVAASAGLSHVLIKIANDTRPYNVDANGNDLIAPVVDALRAKGMQVWGWHYVYGYDPIGEAKIAISQTKRFLLDGYVIDAEVEYKEAGRDAVARTFMTELRRGLPSTPVALSSFRWPTYHRSFPFAAFLEKCDYNMPQVYWMQQHDPAYDLKRSVTEFKAITPYRPIIPTGPAFGQDGWVPTASEVKIFMDTAKSLGLKAVNFYSWDYSRLKLLAVWNEIAKYYWPPEDSPFPPPFDPVTMIFEALNSQQFTPILDIYAKNAVLVTPRKTIQGEENIKTFYEQVLAVELKSGDFRVTSKRVVDNTIHYKWTCTSQTGNVIDGKDTLGIRNDKVIYHYCFYTITS
jgi:hypothetical protein